VDPAQLRQTCLSLPGSFEDFPFGPETSVFKVQLPLRAAAKQDVGKVFALAALDSRPLSVSLKCDPVLARQLRLAHPQITGAYHLNKEHWNGVVCDAGLPDGMIRDMVEDSYDLVVAGLPRSQREALGWKRIVEANLAAGDGPAGVAPAGDGPAAVRPGGQPGRDRT
jgi:predicted DNA-binding protein (MmcQ/YjbR family)